MPGSFLEGFDESRVDVGAGVELRVRTGGSGAPGRPPPRTPAHAHHLAPGGAAAGNGPTLVLWSSRDDLEDLFGESRAIWAGWTADLRGGGPIDSGHHMAEEAPDRLVAALVPFLRM